MSYSAFSTTSPAPTNPQQQQNVWSTSAAAQPFGAAAAANASSKKQVTFGSSSSSSSVDLVNRLRAQSVAQSKARVDFNCTGKFLDDVDVKDNLAAYGKHITLGSDANNTPLNSADVIELCSHATPGTIIRVQFMIEGRRVQWNGTVAQHLVYPGDSAVDALEVPDQLAGLLVTWLPESHASCREFLGTQLRAMEVAEEQGLKLLSANTTFVTRFPFQIRDSESNKLFYNPYLKVELTMAVNVDAFLTRSQNLDRVALATDVSLEVIKNLKKEVEDLNAQLEEAKAQLVNSQQRQQAAANPTAFERRATSLAAGAASLVGGAGDGGFVRSGAQTPHRRPVVDLSLAQDPTSSTAQVLAVLDASRRQAHGFDASSAVSQVAKSGVVESDDDEDFIDKSKEFSVLVPSTWHWVLRDGGSRIQRKLLLQQLISQVTPISFTKRLDLSGKQLWTAQWATAVSLSIDVMLECYLSRQLLELVTYIFEMARIAAHPSDQIDASQALGIYNSTGVEDPIGAILVAARPASSGGARGSGAAGSGSSKKKKRGGGKRSNSAASRNNQQQQQQSSSNSGGGQGQQSTAGNTRRH